MKNGKLDILQNARFRWQWQCVFKDSCTIYGFYTYKTKSGANRAAKRTLEAISKCKIK